MFQTLARAFPGHSTSPRGETDEICVACPTCEGRGFVKTTETVCYEIFREILRQAASVSNFRR